MTDMSNAPPVRPDSPGPPNLQGSLSDRLRIASERGHVDSVKELLAAGAGFRPDQDGRTALHYSSQEGHTDICKLLIVSGSSVNAQDVMGYSPLIRATSQGFQEVVLLLLFSNCDPDLQDEHGNAAIHEACWNGFSKCADLMTGHNCNVVLTNKAGFTALHLAAQNGHNESSRVLLYAGCGTDMKNNYGDTALHTAARYGHAGVARILISAKCHLNEQNKNGDTSLHIASALKRRKIAKILVESGMDVNVLNKQGETAIDVARRKDHPEIILIISTFASSTPPSPPKPVHSGRRHGENFGVTFKDEIELADSPVVCPDEDLPLKTEPLKPEKQERFLFFFKKKKKDKEKEKSTPNMTTSLGQARHHKSNPDIPQHQHQHQHQPNGKPAVHGFFSQYIPREGVQLYRDLAGNVKQGPIGYAPVCQCGPSLKRLETSILDTKESLHKCVESSHNTLSHRLDKLNVQTSQQAQELGTSMRDGFNQEHNACHARISDRLHEERRETKALVGRVNAGMKEEIESWLNDKLASYGHCLDHHHDDTALPPRNLFLDFPGMGLLVRSRSDETLSVSDYSGKHRKKDFYTSRKAAMEQIRGWDVPRVEQDVGSNERNNNNNNMNNNVSTKMVTKAQVHTAPHANKNIYSSRENMLSPRTNSTASPGTYFNSSIHATHPPSLHDQSSSLEQHRQPQPQQQQQTPQTPGRVSRPPVPIRASSQSRVSFSPHQPRHIPRSSSSPPLNLAPPIPFPRSQPNAPRPSHLSGQLHDQASSTHQNLHTGGPPDAVETRSVEQGDSPKPLLNGRDQPRPTSASSNHSGLTGESSSNGSRNSNARTQLTRYQDSYGVRFSRPRTLSSDSLRGDNPPPIPRSRSVENTLEDCDPSSYNSGYATDSVVRSLRSTQSYGRSPVDTQAYNATAGRTTSRYRLPETSAAFHSTMASSSNRQSDGVKSPPPVLPKRNQNYSFKPNQDNTQHSNDTRDSSFSLRYTPGDQNTSGQGESVQPYRPNLHSKGESNFLQKPLTSSLSISTTPLTNCLQHDSFLSPGTSPSLPFANGNKEDSTCSSNQDSGYDSRAHKRMGERKDGDTSGGTPSSSFSVERSSCNTPSYVGSPSVTQKEGQPSDFRDSVVKRLPHESYSYSQSHLNGLNKSKDHGEDRSMDALQERKTEICPSPQQVTRESQQRSVFNNSNRNYPVSQSHYSSYYTNNNRNDYKSPVSADSHSSHAPITPHINNSVSSQSVPDNRQQSVRSSRLPPKDRPVSNESQSGHTYNTPRQTMFNNHSDGRFYNTNVNSSFSQMDTKDTNNSIVPEYVDGGENVSHQNSSVPSSSVSPMPARPLGPSYRASPLSTNNGYLPSPSNRGSNFPSTKPDSNSFNMVSMKNDVNRDSFKSVNMMPLKNSNLPGFNSSTANGDVDTTQTKVQAHIEGWYQRKLIEAAERLRQNHAYDQPTQDVYDEDQTYSASNKQPSNYYQSPPYPGWSGRDSVYGQVFHRPSSTGYQTTHTSDDSVHSRVYPSDNKIASYNNRFEQNTSSPYRYQRSSPYSTDYTYSPETSDGRFRNSDQASQRIQPSDRWNRDLQKIPVEKQNGAMRYDPVHGSDV